MNETLVGALLAGWLTAGVGIVSRRGWLVDVGLVQALAAIGLWGALWLIQHVRVTP